MSYCRWSSDDYQCDVYVYESVYGGFTTHVAGRHHILKEALPAPVDMSDLDGWIERHKKVEKILEKAELVEIGLPCDGKTFNDETAEDCAKRLEELRSLGYRVPQYAIDALRDE